jgi:hypothetical protein
MRAGSLVPSTHSPVEIYFIGIRAIVCNRRRNLLFFRESRANMGALSRATPNHGVDINIVKTVCAVNGTLELIKRAIK